MAFEPVPEEAFYLGFDTSYGKAGGRKPLLNFFGKYFGIITEFITDSPNNTAYNIVSGNNNITSLSDFSVMPNAAPEPELFPDE